MHIDAVQIVAGLFSGDGELRFIKQTSQHRSVGGEVGVILRCGHHRKILARQGCQREVRPAGLDGQATGRSIRIQRHQRPIGEFADNLMQGGGGNCGGTSALYLSGRFVDHLNIKVGGAEHHITALGLDEDICEDWNGVAALNHRLRLGHSLQKRCAFNADLHFPLSSSAGSLWKHVVRAERQINLPAPQHKVFY